MIIDNMDGNYKSLRLWMNPPSAYKPILKNAVLVELYGGMSADIDKPWFSIEVFLKKYAFYSTDVEYDVELLSTIYGFDDLYREIEEYVKGQTDKMTPKELEYAENFIAFYEKIYG